MAITTANRKISKAPAGSTFLSSISKMDLKLTGPGKISSKEVTFFTNQLSLMLDIGTPLNICLSSIGAQIKNPEFKKIIEDITGQVEAGNVMSDALGKYPQAFSHVYVSLVKAGESTGQLREMLERVVELQEKQKKFVSVIKKSLTYPCILCVTSIGVVLFLLIYVFPRFAPIFSEIKDVLPVSTKLLLLLSNALLAYWPVAAAIPILAGWCIYRFTRSARGKLVFDRLKLSLPLVADIYIKVYLTMTMRTLGFLIGSNIPLLDALLIVRRGTGNMVFQGFIGNVKESVEEGRGMSPAFSEASFIPETVKQMVKTGEASQKVAKVMMKLSDHYEAETDDELKRFTSIIEPVLLIMMGVIVGLIVTSIILPIFKLSRMAQ